MKKVAIKTAIITLASIVLVACITLVVVMTAFPSAFASFCANVGSYGVASRFELTAYERSGNVKSAVLSADYAVMSGNDQLVCSSVGQLIGDDEFESFKAAHSDKIEFLTVRYVASRYKVEGASQALVDYAFSCLTGFKAHNQVESLIACAVESSDKVTLSAILDGLNQLKTQPLSAEDNSRLDAAIEVVERALQ